MDVTTALSEAVSVYSGYSSLEGTCISLYDGSDFIKELELLLYLLCCMSFNWSIILHTLGNVAKLLHYFT